MTVDPGWALLIALVALFALTSLAYYLGRLPLQAQSAVAVLRACAQLTIAALVITTAIRHVWLAVALIVFMTAMAVVTTGRRTDTLRRWPWITASLATGIVPTVAAILAARVVPFTGIALIPIAGIIIGNTMNAHTLFGRRAFAALREESGQYDAYLSLGFSPGMAISEIVDRRTPEALIPGLDSIRTAGVVTLPGAFIGVMLGGGSAVQAAAAQVLVLFAIMATQAITVVVAQGLVQARKILPPDLAEALRD